LATLYQITDWLPNPTLEIDSLNYSIKIGTTANQTKFNKMFVRMFWNKIVYRKTDDFEVIPWRLLRTRGERFCWPPHLEAQTKHILHFKAGCGFLELGQQYPTPTLFSQQDQEHGILLLEMAPYCCQIVCVTWNSDLPHSGGCPKLSHKHA
jgi:hypothetical protein